jgi:hypothetical protein
MIPPFDYKEYLACSAMTLIGSTVIALGIAIYFVLAGVPAASIDAAMTRYSVPWFVFWHIWCRVGSQVKLRIQEHESKDS